MATTTAPVPTVASRPRVVAVDDAAALAAVAEAWAALADAAARPFCTPDWMLSWWRHCRPRRALLRVLLVLDGPELIGVGPFWARRDVAGVSWYGLLAAPVSQALEPLARPGREEEVARALADALHRVTPRVDVLVLQGVPEASPWPARLARAWPGRRPALADRVRTASPTVELGAPPSFDAWLATRSSSYRKQMRRLARRLQARGGLLRVTEDPAALPRDLEAFARLHHERWAERGGSGVLDARVERMLAEAAPALLAAGRLRLWSMELDGRIVCSQLFLVAGGEQSWWLGGFDSALASESPTLQVVQAVAADAASRGDSRVVLGPGEQAYKERLANGQEGVLSLLLVPPGSRAPLVRLGVGARVGLRELRAALPPELKDRLRRWARVGRLGADRARPAA